MTYAFLIFGDASPKIKIHLADFSFFTHIGITHMMLTQGCRAAFRPAQGGWGTRRDPSSPYPISDTLNPNPYA